MYSCVTRNTSISKNFSEGFYKTVVPTILGKSQLIVPETSRDICSAFIVNEGVFKKKNPIC